MTKDEFFSLCETHDWFHDCSDDGNVSKVGHQQYRQMVQALRNDESLTPIYLAWSNYVFDGKQLPKREDFE